MTGIREKAGRADALHAGRQPLGLSPRHRIPSHRRRVCSSVEQGTAPNAGSGTGTVSDCRARLSSWSASGTAGWTAPLTRLRTGQGPRRGIPSTGAARPASAFWLCSLVGVRTALPARSPAPLEIDSGFSTSRPSRALAGEHRRCPGSLPMDGGGLRRHSPSTRDRIAPAQMGCDVVARALHGLPPDLQKTLVDAHFLRGGAGGNRTPVHQSVNGPATTIPDLEPDASSLAGQLPVTSGGPRIVFPNCQRSFSPSVVFPTVIPHFCCRAVMDWPRAALLLTMTL